MIDHSKLNEGIELFNAGDFFAAHEALEDVWRQMRGPDRRVMQGLIQVAVAFHHHSNGNLEGARSLLRRAATRLADAPDEFFGVFLPPVRTAIAAWQQALQQRAPAPPLPRLQIMRRC